MCECQKHHDADRVMLEAVRLGLIGIQRGLGAIVKAIEKRIESESQLVRRVA